MAILGGAGGAWQGEPAGIGAGHGAAAAADGRGLQRAEPVIGTANGGDDVTEGETSAGEGSGDQPTQAEGQGPNHPAPNQF